MALALGVLICPVAWAKAQRVEFCPLGGVIVLPGCGSIQFDGAVDPAKLSATERQPVEVTFGGSQEFRVFQIEREAKVDVDFDRAGSFDPGGRAYCPRGDIEHVGTGEARAICRSEIVGFGSATIVTRWNENTPIPVRLTLFRGGRTSKGEHVLIHGFILPPINEPIVAVATLTPVDEGKFGLRASVGLPSIVGGNGALKSFQIKLLRRFGYAVARCPRGRSFLSAQITIVGEDGAETNPVGAIRACTPASAGA